MRLHQLLPTVLALGLAAMSEGTAQADEAKEDAALSVPTEILVIHASNGAGGIAQPLRHLAQLKKPPFSAYKKYTLVSRNAVKLQSGVFAALKLPNGRELRTRLLSAPAPGRYRVSSSISAPPDPSKPNETAYLPLLEVTAKQGETFFVAGQTYQDGILVLGITVGTPPPKKKP